MRCVQCGGVARPEIHDVNTPRLCGLAAAPLAISPLLALASNREANLHILWVGLLELPGEPHRRWGLGTKEAPLYCQ